MPDDHSEVVPLLPIPNRTVKRLSADDSADTRVKVGHRQASIQQPPSPHGVGGFAFSVRTCFCGLTRRVDSWINRKIICQPPIFHVRLRGFTDRGEVFKVRQVLSLVDH